MTSERAEMIALAALEWLAGHDELLPVFLGASGATLEALRDGAGDPALLTSVLDFVLMDDAWVLDLAGSASLAPQEVFTARQTLAGPAGAHWT